MEVYLTSPWIPPEWIQAHGLESRGIWFTKEPAGPLTVRDGVCPFSESVVQFAKAHPASPIVFSTHCDQLRRGFDCASNGSPSFLFNLPATWQSPAAETLFISELRRLSRFLVRLGGHVPSEEELTRVSNQFDHTRGSLRNAASACTGEAFAETLARFYWDGTLALPQTNSTPHLDAVPLALLGGPLPRSQWTLFNVINRTGGRVVLNATETGERPLRITLPATPNHDAVTRLTHGYLESCADVFVRPNARLYLWLKEQLAARRVRGIVLWQYQSCDLWRAEAQSLRQTFGLPLLPLDAAEVTGLPHRSIGRIEAFMESLQ